MQASVLSLQYAAQDGLSFWANGAPNVFQFGGGESKNLRLCFDELRTHHTRHFQQNSGLVSVVHRLRRLSVVETGRRIFSQRENG